MEIFVLTNAIFIVSRKFRHNDSKLTFVEFHSMKSLINALFQNEFQDSFHYFNMYCVRESVKLSIRNIVELLH